MRVGAAGIDRYSVATDTTTNFLPSYIAANGGNGRGIAFDGVNLWYTVLQPGSFTGDGSIHEISPTNLNGADLATIADPFGPGGRGIGAMDFEGAFLWAISYLPVDTGSPACASGVGGLCETVFKIDPTIAASPANILASCDVPFGGGGVGADTLAIANGNILTDAGEFVTPDVLTEYFEPANGVLSPTACSATGNSFLIPGPVPGVTGIDTDTAGNLVVTDLVNLYNVGLAPYGSIVASQAPAFLGEVQDITTATGTGCTAGFWKNHLSSPPWTTYTPGTTLGSVFIIPVPFSSLSTDTFQTALSYRGGPNNIDAARILLRQAVTALLDAANPNVNYPLTTADIISMVNAALASNNRTTMLSLASQLDGFNSLGCPL